MCYECNMCSLLSAKVNVNFSAVLSEDQVQDFIDYIVQKNEIRFDFIRYIAYEWDINPTQRKTLKNLRKVLNVADTNQAILFLLCSKGLGEISDGMKVVSSRANLNLMDYVLMIERIVEYIGGFRFDKNETEIIAKTATELLKSETNPSIRVFCVIRLHLYYRSCRSRYFVGMKHYLRGFVASDISSITDFNVLHDYYQAAYLFLWHFCETDSDLVEIRDLLIDAT